MRQDAWSLAFITLFARVVAVIASLLIKLNVSRDFVLLVAQMPFSTRSPSFAFFIPSRLDVPAQHTLLPQFKGVALIAPAIQGNPPPSPVVAVLRYLVVPLIPRTQIPDMLESGEEGWVAF